MSEQLAKLEKKGGGSVDYDEMTFKSRTTNNYFFACGYLDGIVYMSANATPKVGKHISFKYANSYFTAQALTDGYYEVDGTLGHYTANSNLLNIVFSAAGDHYALWRASDN